MIQFRRLTMNDDVSVFKFNSGIIELDNFFLNESKDYLKEGYSQIYYLKEKDVDQVIGYFAVCCGYLEFRKSLRMRKIKFVPSILLGRLAIDENYLRKSFGSDLIKKAVLISLKVGKQVGCRMVIVDAKTEIRALNFYKNLDFKYLKKDKGNKVERALQRKQNPTEKTIKMYFDLNSIRKI